MKESENQILQKAKGQHIRSRKTEIRLLALAHDWLRHNLLKLRHFGVHEVNSFRYHVTDESVRLSVLVVFFLISQVQIYGADCDELDGRRGDCK